MKLQVLALIRKAILSDEPQIRQCAEEAYARYVQLIGRKPAPMVADFKAHIVADEAFVATDNQGKFEGFIVFYVDGDHILLDNIAVLPQAAGCGVGKALIGFCEKAAQRQGFEKVQLYTNEKMTENLSIYPKLGYVEIDRRTENGFNRVYFEKSITLG